MFFTVNLTFFITIPFIIILILLLNCDVDCQQTDNSTNSSDNNNNTFISNSTDQFNDTEANDVLLVTEFNRTDADSGAVSLSLVQEETNGIGELHAVVGGGVALPCNTSLWGEDEVSLVLWYHGSTGLPIYRVDARNNPLSKSKHSPAEQLSRRVQFDVSTTPPTLRIAPVLATDAGEYRCRVDYKKSRTQNVVVMLNVTVPPKEVIIMDQEGQRLEGIIGPFDEHSTVVLVCEAEGGKPAPEVTWWSGHRLIDTSSTTGPHGLVRNELQLNRINRTDLSRSLTCRAANSNMTGPVEATVTIDINLKPLNVLIVSPSRPMPAGHRSELQCRSSGSRPPAQITWWLGDARLNDVRESVIHDGNTTFSTVAFIPNPDDDKKRVVCRADNPQMNGALEDGRIITVYYPPQLSIKLGAKLHHDSIREGADVFLDCHVTANPWITELSWLFNGQPLFSDPTNGILISNHSLVIQKVKRRHRGLYQCVGFNDEGDSESEPIFLRVHFAPICKSGQKINYGVAKNEAVEVTCDIEADPVDDVQFKWTTNSSTSDSIGDLRSILQVNGTRSLASYTPRSATGYGQLICWAENSIGRQSEPCLFNVVPAGPPEPVKNCVVANHSMTTLLVECLPGDDGGLRTIFVLEAYYSMMEKLHTNATSPTPVFLVKNLTPGTAFTIVVYAFNSKGRSRPVSIAAMTLSPPEKQLGTGTASIEQLVVNPLLGILIGVVASIVLIALVAVIVFKIRSHDYDDGEHHEKNSTAHASHNHLDQIKGSQIDVSRTPLKEEHDASDCVLKEFVDVVNCINESNIGITELDSCELNPMKMHPKPSQNNVMMINNPYGTYDRKYLPNKNGKTRLNDVAYIESGHYGPNGHYYNHQHQHQLQHHPHQQQLYPTSMRRCTIDPKYAHVEFTDRLPATDYRIQQLPPACSCNDVSPGSSSGRGSTVAVHRESPIADGCSETEATVETPLMVSQEIRVNVMPKDYRTTRSSGATPV